VFLGFSLANLRCDRWRCSGHGKQEELKELLRIVKPQHFLPVHGESSFLYAHAELARDLGCNNTSVIRNGEMLGCSELRSRNHVSSGSAASVSYHEICFLVKQNAFWFSMLGYMV
jgi:mRNA degradation ribonuclease J1/J2